MYTFKKFASKSIPKFISAKDEFMYLSKYGKVLDFTSGWTGYATLGHNNKEILDAILLLAKTEGIFTEPAGGVAISVLQKMVEQGKIDKNDKVVCYVTGNGLKATESS